jgi:hypothetical protein
VIYAIGGEYQLIVWHSDAVNGLDPEPGEVFWSVPFQAQFAMAIGAPQLEGRALFLMSYSRKSAMIRVAEDNRSTAVMWEGDTRRGIGGVLNTAIVCDGHIYACGHNGRYYCVKLENGERLWSTFELSARGRPVPWANVFTVRHKDRYFHANDVGDLIIARMSPAGFEELSRAHDLIEPTHEVAGRKLVWAHPAFANRSIYLRNDKEIRCFSLAQK